MDPESSFSPCTKSTNLCTGLSTTLTCLVSFPCYPKWNLLWQASQNISVHPCSCKPLWNGLVPTGYEEGLSSFRSQSPRPAGPCELGTIWDGSGDTAETLSSIGTKIHLQGAALFSSISWGIYQSLWRYMGPAWQSLTSLSEDGWVSMETVRIGQRIKGRLFATALASQPLIGLHYFPVVLRAHSAQSFLIKVCYSWVHFLI